MQVRLLRKIGGIFTQIASAFFGCEWELSVLLVSFSHLISSPTRIDSYSLGFYPIKELLIEFLETTFKYKTSISIIIDNINRVKDIQKEFFLSKSKKNKL